MKKNCLLVGNFFFLLLFASCSKEIDNNESTNLDGQKVNEVNNHVSRTIPAYVPPTVPLSIYSPVGCNYPTYLGRAFAVHNPFPETTLSYPTANLVSGPKFVLVRPVPQTPLVIPAQINPFSHEWEIGLNTSEWILGTYKMYFVRNSAMPINLEGMYQFEMISATSPGHVCW